VRIVVDGLSYPIVIGTEAQEETAALAGGACERAFVVSDRNVASRGELIARTLERNAIAVLGVECLDAGERNKRWKTVARLHDAFVAAGVDRASLIVAVGGGTLTDAAGFAAATYMRGVRWLPVATTVLAMVDAAIGGKTGVDLPQGKNLIGAIWQPLGVVGDLASLSTLSQREAKTGIAEVVKAAVIDDASLLTAVECHDPHSPLEEWAELISRAAAVKARIVAADPNERGKRTVLNLGHTVGHAIEHASKYRIAHGAAVALGLRAEGVIASGLTGWSRDDHQRVLAALRRFGHRLRLGRLSHNAIMSAMRWDKKRLGGALRFVLPIRLGEVAAGVEASEERVREALQVLARAPRRSTW
jgi:3-dehydroquinate synthase